MKAVRRLRLWWYFEGAPMLAWTGIWALLLGGVFVLHVAAYVTALLILADRCPR